MHRPILKLAAVIGLLALLLAASMAVVSADNLLGGKVRTGDVVTVPSTETVNSDLYAFAREVVVDGTVLGDVVAGAGTVTIDGKVDGDVIVAGGTVHVSGAIGGSVIAGGGTVDVNGTVGGAIRVGGGQVTIAGATAHDVAVGGGTLNVGGTVGGDLLFGAGQTTVTGSVTGSIEGSAQSYTRTGTVGGTEHVDITPASTYQSPVPTFTYTRDPILDAIRHFVTVVLLAALALWLVPAGLRASGEVARRRPLPAFGGGILFLALAIVLLLVVVILMVILAVIFAAASLAGLAVLDVVAAMLAFFVVLFGLIVAAAWYSVAVVGLALVRAAMPRLMPARYAAGAPAPTTRLEELALLAGGAAVVIVFTSLPIVGPLVELVVVFVGLGALGIAGWDAWQRRRHGTVGPDGGQVGVTLSWGKPAGS
ncbi:MAG TPA: hypothetical protein VJ506_05620 [Candidatus Limnocylindrales bacterium]|nr:hypothetical protein [Candidatus Limnocylindrales bacterium]